MHLSLAMTFLAFTAQALAAAPPGGGHGAPPDDDPAVEQAKPPPSAQDLMNVYLTIKGLSPMSSAPPTCGIFVQTDHPHPGHGVLLHVSSHDEGHHSAGSAEHLTFQTSAATHPEGLVRHKVGHMVPHDLDTAIHEARTLPPSKEGSNIKAMQKTNCVGWAKGLVARLQQKNLMQKTALQKAGAKAYAYSGIGISAGFAAMYAAPMLKNWMDERRARKGQLPLPSPQSGYGQQWYDKPYDRPNPVHEGSMVYGYPAGGPAYEAEGKMKAEGKEMEPEGKPKYELHPNHQPLVRRRVPHFDRLGASQKLRRRHPTRLARRRARTMPRSLALRLQGRGKGKADDDDDDDDDDDEDLLHDDDSDSGKGSGGHGADTNSGGDDGSHDDVEKDAGDYQGGGSHDSNVKDGGGDSGGDGDDGGGDD